MAWVEPTLGELKKRQAADGDLKSSDFLEYGEKEEMSEGKNVEREWAGILRILELTMWVLAWGKWAKSDTLQAVVVFR